MIRVYVKPGYTPAEREMNFQEAVKKFKRMVNKDGVLQELKAREYFEKPGVKKRKKKEAAIRAAARKKNR